MKETIDNHSLQSNQAKKELNQSLGKKTCIVH